MQLVTAANAAFVRYLTNLETQCRLLGYPVQVYDLGGLGRGVSAEVHHPTFQQRGHYHQMHGAWHTKALHKPKIVQDALKDDLLVYLDADACPVQRFDEIWDHDFDIGVTVRDPHEPHSAILGKINAGVIFLRPSAKPFLSRWVTLTRELGNDQLALNALIQEPGIRVHKFPTRIYNYYYFPEKPGPEVKIYHFKQDPQVRPWFDHFVAAQAVRANPAGCPPDAPVVRSAAAVGTASTAASSL
jgi:hypothetical protein